MKLISDNTADNSVYSSLVFSFSSPEYGSPVAYDFSVL